MNTSNLRGRTATITGAGSGIGQAVAKTLWRSGCSLILVGRRHHKLLETREQCLAEQGVEDAAIHVESMDATDLVSVRRLSKLEVAANVDIIINSAGMHGGFPLITESDPEQWSKVLNTNVVGPYYMTRLFAPGMKQREWGRIINMSSAASLSEPQSAGSVYSLSKIALNRFTRQLAQELEGTGVTANAIHPGEVKTEMWRAIKDDTANRGAAGDSLRTWAEMVEKTGGDPPQKAADLVLEIIAGEYSGVNGRFLWIEDGIQKPAETW